MQLKSSSDLRASSLAANLQGSPNPLDTAAGRLRSPESTWYVFIAVYVMLCVICASMLALGVPWAIPAILMGIATLLGIAMKPIFGICLAFAILPVGRGLGVGSDPGAALSADRAMAILLAGGVLIHLMLTRRGFYFRGAPLWMLTVLASLGLLSISWSEFPPLTILHAVSTVQMMAWILLIVTVVLHHGSLIWPLRAFVIACLFVALVAPLFGLSASVGVGRFTFGVSETDRVNPNSIANLFGLGFLTSMYLNRTDPIRWMRWLWLLGLLVMPVMILLTGSRTGIMATAAAMLVPLIMVQELVRKPGLYLGILTLVVLAGVLGWIGTKLLTTAVYERITSVTYAQETYAVRLSFIKESIDYVTRHPLGAGWGTFHTSTGMAVHNDLFYCLSGLGWIGGAAFMTFAISMLVAPAKMPMGWEKWYARSLSIYLLVFGLAGAWMLAKHYWVFMTVAALFSQIYRLRTSPQAQTPLSAPPRALA